MKRRWDVQAERLEELLLSSFPGRRDVYAEQGKDGSYFPVMARDVGYEPLETEAVKLHLDGRRTVGVYPVVENHVRLVCWDVDNPHEDEARTIARAVKRVLVVEDGLPETCLSLEFSGRKGYHIWLYLAEWESVRDARDYGRWVADRAGEPTMEVFPKGEVREGGLGNLVKLPLALHRVSGRRSCFVDAEWTPVGAMAHLRQRRPLAAPIFRECVRRARAARPAPSPSAAGQRAALHSRELLPCAQSILVNGEGEGARNHALFALALACKRAGYSRGEAEGAVEAAAARCRPPVLPREAAVPAASAYRMPGDGFDCRAPVLHGGPTPHCASTCPRYHVSFGAAR